MTRSHFIHGQYKEPVVAAALTHDFLRDCDCMWAHVSMTCYCASVWVHVCVCVCLCSRTHSQSLNCGSDLLCSLSVSLALGYSLHATLQSQGNSGTLPELALSLGCLVCLVCFSFFPLSFSDPVIVMLFLKIYNFSFDRKDDS